MILLEATETCIVRGYGQYNKGERAVFSDEDAVPLLDYGWRECPREDAVTKAPAVPPSSKMVKQPERKK